MVAGALLLPSTRHAKDLIDHARFHMKTAREKDRKFALIHTDNAIEALLKERARYAKQRPWRVVYSMGFQTLVNENLDLEEVEHHSQNLMAVHDLRNLVYHVGSLAPSKEDVNSAISHAILLFNACHPKTPFKDPRVTLPSRRTLVAMSKQDTHSASHLLLMRKFSDYLTTKGYAVAFEVRTKDGYRLDMTARKGKTVFVFEFKSGGYGSLFGGRTIRRFKGALSGLPLKSVRKVVPYLVTDTTFTPTALGIARRHGIRLIQGGNPKSLMLR